MSDRPGDHFEPPLGTGDVDRMWYRIRERQETKVYRKWTGAALGAAALAGLLLWLWPRPPVPWDGTEVVAEAARTLHLPDASRLALEPETQVRGCDTREGACVVVKGGRVRFDVTPRTPERGTFVVRAEEARITVLGTRFIVTNGPEPDDVVVEVLEGRVAVESGRTRIVLYTGDRWPAARAEAPEPPAAPVAEAPEPPAPPPTSSVSVRRPRPADRATAPAEPSVRTLWQRARAARRALDFEAERDAYLAILRRHPGRRSAGLAALALGRLELDTFEDAEEALRHLRVARRNLRGSELDQEVIALLVRAYARADDREACLRVRSAYQRTYPTGAHAKALESLCEQTSAP